MKIKLIALFIMMGSLAAVADNDTYFFSKVDYGSVFVVQTADGFLYHLKSATIIQYTIKGRFMSR